MALSVTMRLSGSEQRGNRLAIAFASREPQMRQDSLE